MMIVAKKKPQSHSLYKVRKNLNSASTGKEPHPSISGKITRITTMKMRWTSINSTFASLLKKFKDRKFLLHLLLFVTGLTLVMSIPSRIKRLAAELMGNDPALLLSYYKCLFNLYTYSLVFSYYIFI